MPTADLPLVAVVGGGFSGLMTALHLARSGAVRVKLIEKTERLAQGAAYSTLDPDHLLNVRAANMSAWPDQPDHFARWLAARHPDAPPAFARRAEYGLYLRDQLETTLAEAGDRLRLCADAAVDIAASEAGWRVTLGCGTREHVDAVVLAVGNPPPATPTGLTPAALASPLYLPDPWRLPEQSRPASDAPILLIGSGLTMVDVVLSLARRFPGRRLVALSRRGLKPLAHAPTGSLPAEASPSDASPAGLTAWLKAQAAHHGWRETIDALRPHTQAIWRGWSDQRREAFLRHARPYWDIHRHRLAPPVAERMEALIADGTLTLLAGRIRALEPAEDGLSLTWTPRGSRESRTLPVSQAINCTGPGGALATHHDPLLDALAREGHARCDAQRLGLEVDAEGRLVGYDDQPRRNLFAVGPVTRGAFWEITAAPDIRLQAEKVAETVVIAVGAA